MKSKFSKTWNRSVQPRKQRKFIANAPLHLKGKLIRSTLSKELRTKHNKRNMRLRTGDKVKVLRGNFKGAEQKVESIEVKSMKVYLEKVDFTKKDGSKATRPFNASNLMITSLNLDDKKRMQKLKGEK
ncbi:MAG: 50S ribosomal protein L24 [archaeon]